MSMSAVLAISCCARTMRLRTAGHLETALAAAETSPVRMSSLTSSPKSSVRCAPFSYFTCTSTFSTSADSAASLARSAPLRSAYSPNARYIAPVSRCRMFSLSAT